MKKLIWRAAEEINTWKRQGAGLASHQKMAQY